MKQRKMHDKEFKLNAIPFYEESGNFDPIVNKGNS